MPLEGDNNSSTEESIPDSGRGGSDEGSITRALESDIGLHNQGRLLSRLHWT